MAWIDAHCHLDDIEDVPGTIARAQAAGVAAMVTIGTDLPTSRAAARLAGENGTVWAAVGVHPHDAATLDDEAFSALEELAHEPRVVAIGEVGLDYFRDLSPRETQRAAFRRQLGLAKDLGTAVVIHMRDAHDELFGTLEEVGPPERLIFHCFSGGPADAERGLALGGYISFAGNVSYKTAGAMREAAGVVPLDRLMVETDSPYLAPVPHRGKPNEPAWVVAVGEAVAGAVGLSPDEVARRTAANTVRAFGLPSDLLGNEP